MSDDITLTDGKSAPLTQVRDSKLPGDKTVLELIADRIECLPSILETVNRTLIELQQIKVHDAAKFEKIESDLRSLCESVKELKRDNAADLARFSDLEKRIKVLEDRIQALELLTNQ